MTNKRIKRTIEDVLQEVGNQFNRLTLLAPCSKYPRDKAEPWYGWCSCSCGEELPVRFKYLLSGNTGSCGCFHKEQLGNLSRTHGYSQGKNASRLYSSWQMAKSRCFNKNFPKYKNYGGRGISMHSDFVSDFSKYHDYLLSIEPNLEELLSKGFQVDRREVNGDYTYGNLRLVTVKDNCNNRTNNRYINLYGNKLTLAQAEEKYNIDQKLLLRRLNRGYSDMEALIIPVGVRLKTHRKSKHV